MTEFPQSSDDRWAWRCWFAWRPVYALLLRSSDPAASLTRRWDGEPMQRLIWLRFVDRRFVLGRWHYRRRARLAPVAKRKAIQASAALADLALTRSAPEHPRP